MKKNVRIVAGIATLIVVVLMGALMLLQDQSKNSVNKTVKQTSAVSLTTDKTAGTATKTSKEIEILPSSEPGRKLMSVTAPEGTASETEKSPGEEKKQKLMALQERVIKMNKTGSSYEETDQLLADLIEFNGGNELNGVDLEAVRGFLRRTHRLDEIMQEVQKEVLKSDYDSAKVERLKKEMQELQNTLTKEAGELKQKAEAIGAQPEPDRSLALKNHPAKPKAAKIQTEPKRVNTSLRPEKPVQ